jgi:hypothetical protein
VHKFELGEYSLAKRKPRFHGGVKAPPNGRPGQPIPATISSIKSIEFSVRQDTLYRTHTLQFWPAQHDWIRRYFVFERATYALEEFVAVVISLYFNELHAEIVTV